MGVLYGKRTNRPHFMALVARGTAWSALLEEGGLQPLDSLLDPREKLHRVVPVHHAMVVAERDIHHRSDFDPFVQHNRPPFDPVEAEDGHLRRVQNRRAPQRAEDAAVRVVKVPPEGPRCRASPRAPARRRLRWPVRSRRKTAGRSSGSQERRGRPGRQPRCRCRSSASERARLRRARS
jgi:hypothetical protein